ncbi:NAD(P)/FAD-dependent oxidoreductase [Phycisphaerales bacterium AB-hyl4]|uniref:NAD(P)/FAD-dependent oxidoreductase n=1 Tax=Natronomicrosphaera hydrolytica TaxID=3242702 RepID=A0ABV4U527_9BACT
MDAKQDYDVLIVGGGPTGSTAALALARKGWRVAILEKATFPRFQIGESFLPAGLDVIQKLGLEERVRQMPHVDKYGVEFAFGDGRDCPYFDFGLVMTDRSKQAFNAARADYDQMLIDAAKEAGATVHQPVTVREIEQLADDAVRLGTDKGTFTGRYVLDASGQATLLGKHLNIRTPLPDDHLQNVAYFGHFENVVRQAGKRQGDPTIVMCDEGWFWIIPLNEQHTSVGVVLRPHIQKQVGVPADQMLQWAIARSPLMRERMANAVGPDRNKVRGDFSYRCDPSAGPGYFLIGDAAMFLDPVFSTGVCVGMRSALCVSEHLDRVLAGKLAPAKARRQCMTGHRKSMKLLVRSIQHYYRHSFREFLMQGQGPLKMHCAFITVVAGYVVPRTPPGVWWRYRLFELCMLIQDRLPLAPRHARFSLLAQPAEAPEPTREPAAV